MLRMKVKMLADPNEGVPDIIDIIGRTGAAEKLKLLSREEGRGFEEGSCKMGNRCKGNEEDRSHTNWILTFLGTSTRKLDCSDQDKIPNYKSKEDNPLKLT